MKTVLTISRKWHNPQIHTTISQDGISLSIDIEDFEKALLNELGSVATVITRKQLKNRMQAAIKSVLEGIKEESAKVI
jgi:hypothetical protein